MTAVVSPDGLAQARVAAAEVRARWRKSLLDGMVTVDDLLRFAATIEGGPLRSMRLSDVLASQADWSQARAHTAVARLRRELGVDVAPSKLTVRWLLDGRTSRHREWALVQRRPTTPFDGFPFAPEPE